MSSPAKSKRFESLDAFRGLSAICVVVFHMRAVGSITELAFFRGSAIFVDFFFVLSGFVMAYGYAFRDNLKFISYMSARFFRLYPLHLFMFFMIVLLEAGKWVAYKQGGFIFNNKPFTGPYSISEVIPNLLLLQSWLPFSDTLSFNIPSWSISTEFYLYVILFLTIISFKKFKAIAWLTIFVMALYLLISDPIVCKNEILRGLSCFFAGSFTYTIYRKISNLTINYTLGSIVEALLVFGVIYIVQSKMEFRQLAATISFCIVVLFFAYESGLLSQVLKNNILQLCGKLSYSIYMVHASLIFCLVSFFIILQKITHIEIAPMIDGIRYLTTGNGIINSCIVILFVIMVIFVSNFTYKYVELKGQAFGKKMISNRLKG